MPTIKATEKLCSAKRSTPESQGYYQGYSKVWLPKQSLQKSSMSKPQHSLSKPRSSLEASTSKSARTWKPKASTSLEEEDPLYNIMKTLKIWLPKRQSEQQKKVEVISNSISNGKHRWNLIDHGEWC